jgi:hypothetical protein
MDRKNRLKKSIRSLIIASKIFGIFPLKFNSDSISFSIFGLIHGILTISFIAIGYAYFFIQGNLKMTDSYWVVTSIAPLLGVITAASFIFNAKFFSKAIIDIFNYSTIIKSNLFFVRIFWFLIVMFVIIEFFVGYCYIIPYINETLQWELVLSLIYWNILSNILAIVNFWFFVLIMILCKVFNEVNEEINHFDLMSCGKYNFFIDLGNFSRENKFFHIVDFYKKICDTCDVVNKCFGMSIAAHTFYVILSLVSGLFVVFKRSFFDICFLGHYLIIFTLVEYLVLFSCQRIVNEVSCLFMLLKNILAILIY